MNVYETNRDNFFYFLYLAKELLTEHATYVLLYREVIVDDVPAELSLQYEGAA